MKLTEIPPFLKDFFLNQPFALMYSVSNRGKGKTVFMTLFAWYYSLMFPNNTINANYHLNKKKIPHFTYNPYSFFPFKSLYNQLILIDDCKNVKCCSKVVEITANDSRKSNLYLILTAQYPKFVAKPLREMAEFYIEVEVDNLITVNGKKRLSYDSKCLVHLIDLDYNSTYWLFDDVLKIVETLFNTDEKVLMPLDKYIVTEVFKYSKSKDDVLINLLAYYSKTEAIKIYKRFGKYTIGELKSMHPDTIQALHYGI